MEHVYGSTTIPAEPRRVVTALLDQDLIVVVGTEREVLEANPLFSNLNAVRERRIAYLGGFD